MDDRESTHSAPLCIDGCRILKNKNSKVFSKTALQLNDLFLHGCFAQMPPLSVQTVFQPSTECFL